MRAPDRSAVFIGLADLLLCVLAVVIVAVNPKAVNEGVKINAEYLITAQWPVGIDADVDLHTIVPDGKSGADVFYRQREYNNVSLDHDNKGFIDAFTVQADGAVVKAAVDEEMTTIRGKVPGHFDVGVHMYNFHRGDTRPPESDTTLDTPVKVQVIQLNPHNKIVFDKTVTLTHIGECNNVVSFDLDREGQITFVDPPLEPVTHHAFESGHEGGPPP